MHKGEGGEVRSTLWAHSWMLDPLQFVPCDGESRLAQTTAAIKPWHFSLPGIYENLDLIPSTIKSFTSLQNTQVLRDLKPIHFAICQNKFHLKCDCEHPEAMHRSGLMASRLRAQYLGRRLFFSPQLCLLHLELSKRQSLDVCR